MKRVFIVHGWDGTPQEGWFPWLSKELSAQGFVVDVLSMPDPGRPVIGSWVSALAEAVGIPDKETFLVGHSNGCQTILRYLSNLADGQIVGGAVLVAGWTRLTDAATPNKESALIASPWMETPVDWAKVKSHCSAFSALFSDNDLLVPLDERFVFEKNLGAKILLLHNKRHFSGDDGITELPEVLGEVVRMVQY